MAAILLRLRILHWKRTQAKVRVNRLLAARMAGKAANDNHKRA